MSRRSWPGSLSALFSNEAIICSTLSEVPSGVSRCGGGLEDAENAASASIWRRRALSRADASGTASEILAPITSIAFTCARAAATGLGVAEGGGDSSNSVAASLRNSAPRAGSRSAAGETPSKPLLTESANPPLSSVAPGPTTRPGVYRYE
jgi:hypothetical protein